MNICVFCSSTDNLDPSYYTTGYVVGRLIAEHGHTLVFGGYTRGIMGAVARGVQEAGGKVISVIPQILLKVRPNFESGAEVYVMDSMSSRKDKMLELADAFLSLPGGVGTLDEVFQVIAMKVVGETKKPIAFLIQGASQEKLVEYMNQACDEGFISRATMSFLGFCSNPRELLDYIENQIV